MNKIVDHIQKNPQLAIQFEPQDGNRRCTGENIYVSALTMMVVTLFQKSLQTKMEAELRNQVHPKIIGAVTRGKLSNRGIKMVFNMQDMTTWYEQRGFQCTRKYKLIIEPIN